MGGILQVDTIQNNNATTLITQTNSTTLTFGATSQTISVPSVASFATTIGVGGATPAASGAGITFPASVSASSDANTLDDYEEGTFTPVLTGSTSGTFNGAGAYTKVGSLVYVGMQFLTITTANKPIGDYTITGLPFTSKATTPDATSFFIYLVRPTFNTSGIPLTVLGENATSLSLVQMVSNDVPTAITDANFVNAFNMFFRVNGSYIAS
jgi:hypothetical protein